MDNNTINTVNIGCIPLNTSNVTKSVRYNGYNGSVTTTNTPIEDLKAIDGTLISELYPGSFNTYPLKCDSHNISPINIEHNVINIDPKFIKELNVLVPNKVIELIFKDGTKTKVVCQEPDTFSWEAAVGICVAKKVMGGSSKFNNKVNKLVRDYNLKIKKQEEMKLEEERKKAKKQKLIEKKKARKAKIIENKIEMLTKALEKLNLKEDK